MNRSSSSLVLLLGSWVSIGHAASLDLGSATIADLNAAFDKGTLTSEELVGDYLARIAAYDKQGPALNTVITANTKALAEAKALDAERKLQGPRSPLHGVPILLKDNFNTFDLPTSVGCYLLKDSVPSSDAFIVNKLREAGAIILAKVNTTEFAGGGGGTDPLGYSTAGGQTRNAYDPSRIPGGSSGGTGAGIAAAFAQFGLGSDTGGSIRNPCSFNGLAGLKPTRGLLSRSGIAPLALTFDTGGPMARSVYDVAVSLGVMTGIDPADTATETSIGHAYTDYTPFLKVGALKGARIGIARDFMGHDAETDRIVAEAIATLEKQGATVVDVRFPDYFLASRRAISSLITPAEFKSQIGDYLKTLAPGFPKSLTELVSRASAPGSGYPSAIKRDALKKTDETALALSDPLYQSVHDDGLAFIMATVVGQFDQQQLDAIVYPTWPKPATLITEPYEKIGLSISATNIANQTGFPDLIVPAGFTKEGLPVTLSFLGRAYSEPKLLGYGYDFEQATRAYRLPPLTPALASDSFSY